MDVQQIESITVYEERSKARAIVGFNVGVEIGQIIVVTVVLPVLQWL